MELVTSINLEEEISKLKKELNAVVLAHYYQDSEIQDIADFTGDSLELAKKAKSTNADYLVFCGVKFMAESASILNPGKKVIIPDMLAGCSLESSCPPDKFKSFIEKYPNHLVVTYINSSVEVKAMSDYIVTSSNAERVINSIPEDREVIFGPDRHLGNYLSKKTGRKMILWPGSCLVHENFSERELIQLKTLHPKARVIAHPECPEDLLYYAEHIGSTSSMINYTKNYNGSEFIVLTEPGIIHQMRRTSPDSKFYDVPSLGEAGCVKCSDCPFMKLNTIEKLYLCMKNKGPEVLVDPLISAKAMIPLNRMMSI
ncbi:MAG: quinolinate synthase NadA [Alphaproteobacteria bacterium]|nr:quinolinate synthase NadA [Alphaproteobacteria bacterium]